MRIALCDDNHVQLDILEDAVRNCGSLCTEELALDKFSNGSDLLDAVNNGSSYSFIFLDINMPEKNGFEVYKEVDADETSVIFVTTHIELLPDAIALRPYGFIPKPYSQDIFNHTVEIVLKQKAEAHYFYYSESGAKRRLPCRKIYYFAADNHDLLVFTTSGMIVLNRTALDSVEPLLAQYGFFRCNRNHFVNMKHCLGRKGNSVVFKPEIKAEEVIISKRRLRNYDTQLLRCKWGDCHEF